MSDELQSEVGIEVPEAFDFDEAERELELQRKRAQADHARKVKMAKRADAQRTAPIRTAADVRAEPAPVKAERAEIAREPSLPESELPTRRSRHDRRTTGPFDIPAHRRKPGWDYFGMAITVLNEPVDRSSLRDFSSEGGWRAVLSQDMPELCDPGTPRDTPIEALGLRLMMRPLSLTREAQQEDYEYAQQQQYDKMRSASSGVSARRDEEGIPDRRGIRRVQGDVVIQGVAG